MLCVGFGDIDETLIEFGPDLVVARPPDCPPQQVLDRLHERTDAPVMLLLPADHPREDLIEALKAGADDVVIESTDLEELVTRVDALLRRAAPRSNHGAGDVTIDLDAHTAWRGGHRLDLTETEFSLLDVLVRNAGVVISKRRLLTEVWGFEDYSVNVAEVHVSALRRKLEKYGPRIIETVRAHGYIIRDGHREPMNDGADDDRANQQLSWLSPEELRSIR